MKRFHGVLEVGRGEVWPAAIREVELGVGAFPEKEITESLLATGPNQKIDVTAFAVPVVDPAHRPRQILACDFAGILQMLRSSNQRVTS